MSEEERIGEEMALALLNFDRDKAIELAKEALEKNVSPVKLIQGPLARAMKIIGDKFDRGEIFLPHLVLAGETMKEIVNILLSKLPSEEAERSALGNIVIGVIEGDIHDIGKNVVAALLRAARFNVVDLGADVPVEKFVEEAKKQNANIIAISAMMTTTMPGMKDVIDVLSEVGYRDKVKVMVGGASVTESYAEKIGADGYGQNASEAVKKARELLGLSE